MLSEETKSQLKELSFQMMLNETTKMGIENSRSFSIETGNGASIYSTKEGAHRGLVQADKKGYELSLVFNELLLQNGKKHNAFDNGPDAANIAAENLLYKYGLRYPISWYIDYEDWDGLHFGYHYSDRIDKDHAIFLAKIERLGVNEDIKERLRLAAEYYSRHHKLLSKYHNGEVLEESKSPTRH